jgi:hypothetical protein
MRGWGWYGVTIRARGVGDGTHTYRRSPALDDAELAAAMRTGNVEPDQEEVMSYADDGDHEAFGLVRRGYPEGECAGFIWRKVGEHIGSERA